MEAIEKKSWETKQLGDWTLVKFMTKTKNEEGENEVSMISINNKAISWMLNVSEDLMLYHLLDAADEDDPDDPALMVLTNVYYVSILLDAKLHGKVMLNLAEFVEGLKYKDAE